MLPHALLGPAWGPACGATKPRPIAPNVTVAAQRRNDILLWTAMGPRLELGLEVELELEMVWEDLRLEQVAKKSLKISVSSLKKSLQRTQSKCNRRLTDNSVLQTTYFL